MFYNDNVLLLHINVNHSLFSVLMYCIVAVPRNRPGKCDQARCRSPKGNTITVKSVALIVYSKLLRYISCSRRYFVFSTEYTNYLS